MYEDPDGWMNGEISTYLEGYMHALMYVCMCDWMTDASDEYVDGEKDG